MKNYPLNDKTFNKNIVWYVVMTLWKICVNYDEFIYRWKLYFYL